MSEWDHDKVNDLLKGRCERSCMHFRWKTPDCWLTCQTAQEYIANQTSEVKTQ